MTRIKVTVTIKAPKKRPGAGTAVFWPTTALAIKLRDGYRCLNCEKDLLTVPAADCTLDHLVTMDEYGKMSPEAQEIFGNVNDASNVVTCCGRCNFSRQATPWRDFYSTEAQARVEAAIARAPLTQLARDIRAGRAAHPREA
jgi:hypothetical protein